ncbi:MAG: hypothetical protein ACKO0M_01045 [Cyanobium sp.]
MTTNAGLSLWGWQFDLVLHGSRVQLEGHHNGDTISCWLTPTESIHEAAHQLLQAPSCCLM